MMHCYNCGNLSTKTPVKFFVQVWGNGANFDNTILRRSYERQGIPCPWRYYNDRDVRTIVELGKAIDFDARTAIPFEGERHNALDDARYQANTFQQSGKN
ncbi:exonuclease family protein [Escherichia coli O157:H43 str. T22]|nr:exonuclease family protein [Escherichia coli O157:H43 str. T22]